jgi:hypothetical protein
MIADEVNRPGAHEDERCNHGDDGGADHEVAPFVFAGISPVPPKAIRSGSHPVNSDPHHNVPDAAIGMRSHFAFEDQSGGNHNLVKCTVTIEPNDVSKCFLLRHFTNEMRSST